MLKISKTNLMKKFLSGLLVMLILISIMPITAYAGVELPASFDVPKHFGANIISMRMAENLDETDSKEIVPLTSIKTEEAKKPETMPDSGIVSNEWLIGFWGHSDSNTNADLSMDFMYEFKADGTYYVILSSLWRGARTATYYEGKYKVSVDKLILSERLKGTGPASATHFKEIWYVKMDSYTTKDEAVEDSEFVISKTEDDKLIIGGTQFTRGSK